MMKLNVPRPAMFRTREPRNEHVRELGLYLRMEVDLGLLHPDHGPFRANRTPEPEPEEPGRCKADIGQSDLRVSPSRLDLDFVVLPPFRSSLDLESSRSLRGPRAILR